MSVRFTAIALLVFCPAFSRAFSDNNDRTVSAFDKVVASAYLSCGKGYADKRDYDRAIRGFSEAIRLSPDDSALHVQLGNLLARQGKYKEGEESLRTAVRVNPDNPKAHYNLGHVLGEQRRYPEEEAALREAVRLDPGYAYAHNNLGVVLARQGRHEEAVVACRDRAPSAAPACRGRAWRTRRASSNPDRRPSP